LQIKRYKAIKKLAKVNKKRGFTKSFVEKYWRNEETHRLAMAIFGNKCLKTRDISNYKPIFGNMCSKKGDNTKYKPVFGNKW
jgi:hypothetical protein